MLGISKATFFGSAPRALKNLAPALTQQMFVSFDLQQTSSAPLNRALPELNSARFSTRTRPEYSSDPFFDDSSKWLLNNASISGGTAQNTTTTDALISNLAVIFALTGEKFLVTINVTTCANGAEIEYYFGGTAGTKITAAGIYKENITAAGSGSLVINFSLLTAPSDVVITSITVEKL